MKEGKKTKKKKSARKKLAIILCSIIATILLLAGVVVLVLVHYISKMNYEPLKEDYTILAETQSFVDDVTNPEEVTSADTDEAVIDDYEQAASEALENVDADDYQPIGDVYNILLIGSDTRKSGENGRSDTMLLISINRTEKKIVATSFLRDLYVYIPTLGYDKINSAYAYGGVELLLDTLEYNFSLSVDRYIAVDFYSFIKVVDILGGLDVDVQEDELYWCNQYIHASNLLTGDDEDEGYLTYADGSYQHLNGKQTLAYARFRFVGNGDFTRTERQRKVVQLLFDKMTSVSASQIVEILDEVLPEVTTNIPTGEFLELIGTMTQIKNYDIIQGAVPDGDFKYLVVDGQSCIGVDFNYYIDELYNRIYGSGEE